jgi:hypothetical protein
VQGKIFAGAGVSARAQAIPADDHFAEDFHQGITEPIEILHHIPARDGSPCCLATRPASLPASRGIER